MSDAAPPERDLRDGIGVTDLEAGEPCFGRVDDAPVYVLKVGDEIRAFGAKCTHYGGPLADGAVHDGTVRCPWHHASFSLADGTVRGGPAFNPLPRYDVTVRDGKAFVGDRQDRDPLEPERAPVSEPDSVVIVGAGPAGATAAETLRREGYAGPITMIDGDPDAPYDRPNLSKAYLAGDAPEEWLPLRSRDFYREHDIERIEARVAGIDTEAHRATLDTGRSLEYGALILATGAVPRTLDGPGMGLPHVRTLRSLTDCREIIEAAHSARSVVIVGASFIGMEVAASLRARGLEVAVVAPEQVPFQSTLGTEIGTFLLGVHEAEGVTFHLGRSVAEILVGEVVLDDDTRLDGDLVIVGVGVKPDTALAARAGLDVDDGVLVDRYLEASAPDVYAAGDIARYPDARSGRRVRIEHWVVAGRQGRTAARNVLGRREPFRDVPFFWTRHFGRSVTYVGNARSWTSTERDGQCADEGCSVGFWKDGRRLALATVSRSGESLAAEIAMEEEARTRPAAD